MRMRMRAKIRISSGPKTDRDRVYVCPGTLMYVLPRLNRIRIERP